MHKINKDEAILQNLQVNRIFRIYTPNFRRLEEIPPAERHLHVRRCASIEMSIRQST